jgi:hypothetical protein
VRGGWLAFTLRAKSVAQSGRAGPENSQTNWLDPVMIAQLSEVDESVTITVSVATAPRSDYNCGYDIKAKCLEGKDNSAVKVQPQPCWPAALAWLWACTTLFAVYAWIFIELFSRARADN